MTNLSHCIIFVSDMSRSVQFYRDTLGLALKFESPEWSEFVGSGTTLALHAGGPSQPQPGSGPGPAPGGTCQPGFKVEDLDAVHARLIAKGVRCVRPPTMQDFGAKL